MTMQLSPMILTFTQLGDDHRPFLESLHMAAEAGYREISLLTFPGGPAFRSGSAPAVSFIDVFASDWAALRSVLEDHGLKCRHVHAGGLDVSGDEAAAESAASLSDAALSAYNFGAEVVSFGIGPQLPVGLPWDEKRPYLDRTVTAFRAVEARIEGVPVQLGVDIHYRAPVETVRDASYVLEQSGQSQVGLCVNTGHLTTSGEPGWELVERFPEAVALVAYKDHVIGAGVNSVRLGAGDTPLDKYVAAVQSAQRDIYQVVSIEHEPWNEKGVAAQESREYLESLVS
jgi:sugar phosphate isomerase/epimerase